MDTQQHAVSGKPRSVVSYPEHPPLTVTVNEAKRISGLGRSKLYELIKQGRLESVRVDDRRLINWASLRRLLGIG
jgi:excisionase family DNA binding protein